MTLGRCVCGALDCEVCKPKQHAETRKCVEHDRYDCTICSDENEEQDEPAELDFTQ